MWIFVDFGLNGDLDRARLLGDSGLRSPRRNSRLRLRERCFRSRDTDLESLDADLLDLDEADFDLEPLLFDEFELELCERFDFFDPLADDELRELCDPLLLDDWFELELEPDELLDLDLLRLTF